MKPELEQQIKDMVENGHELLFMEPRADYDECIVGIGERFTHVFVVYSRKCVLDRLHGAIDGIAELPEAFMTEDDAEEFYSFNILGAWVGDGTPAFLIDDDLEGPVEPVPYPDVRDGTDLPGGSPRGGAPLGPVLR